MTPEQMKRIAEIADEFALTVPIVYDDVRGAILAALADPLLRQEIENAALEQAAKVCDEIMKDNEFTPPFVCAAAIRAMKECVK